MADEQGVAPDQSAAGDAPSANILAQYVKDLSFENPNSPGIYQANETPKIDVQFNIGSDAAGEGVWEVMLKMDVSAKLEQGTAFQVELAYAGLFALSNIPDQQREAFLLVEAPRILFPFARRILADTVRDGNFPPLMLEPIDFAALYMQQKAQMAQGGSDNVDIDSQLGQA
ncbi:protein-export chaperone SecB [Parasphingopyxis algicola]|uniref:protein-export chaperone SecB n=1 Tax=Parasphingopyxis algicola TaxID=2026624 RepID=UPI0015A064ED|nr:protein-export chaperone SecB [Parasphingopyxis algicola]QLC24426.1 protein-export chaperone SecB [Parasphingopyxis algicola]